MATLIVRSRSLSRSLATCSWLNNALLANVGEPPRTLLQLDKLGVTGSTTTAHQKALQTQMVATHPERLGRADRRLAALSAYSDT